MLKSAITCATCNITSCLLSMDICTKPSGKRVESFGVSIIDVIPNCSLLQLICIHGELFQWNPHWLIHFLWDQQWCFFNWSECVADTVFHLLSQMKYYTICAIYTVGGRRICSHYKVPKYITMSRHILVCQSSTTGCSPCNIYPLRCGGIHSNPLTPRDPGDSSMVATKTKVVHAHSCYLCKRWSSLINIVTLDNHCIISSISWLLISFFKWMPKGT